MATYLLTLLAAHATASLVEQLDGQEADDAGNIFNFHGDIYGDINGFAYSCCDSDGQNEAQPEEEQTLEFVTYNAAFVPGAKVTSDIRVGPTTAQIVDIDADVLCL